MLQMQETNNKLKISVNGPDQSGLVIRSSHEADIHSQEIIQMLKSENQALKDELEISRR
jgi:hypothetical protein